MQDELLQSIEGKQHVKVSEEPFKGILSFLPNGAWRERKIVRKSSEGFVSEAKQPYDAKPKSVTNRSKVGPSRVIFTTQIVVDIFGPNGERDLDKTFAGKVRIPWAAKFYVKEDDSYVIERGTTSFDYRYYRGLNVIHLWGPINVIVPTNGIKYPNHPICDRITKTSHYELVFKDSIGYLVKQNKEPRPYAEKSLIRKVWAFKLDTIQRIVKDHKEE